MICRSLLCNAVIPTASYSLIMIHRFNSISNTSVVLIFCFILRSHTAKISIFKSIFEYISNKFLDFFFFFTKLFFLDIFEKYIKNIYIHFLKPFKIFIFPFYIFQCKITNSHVTFEEKTQQCSIYIYTHTHTHTHTYIYIYIYIYICVCVYTYTITFYLYLFLKYITISPYFHLFITFCNYFLFKNYLLFFNFYVYLFMHFFLNRFLIQSIIVIYKAWK